jgi:phage/plasmid-associated DNA primase
MDVDMIAKIKSTLQFSAKIRALGGLIFSEERFKKDSSYVLDINRRCKFLIPIKGGKVVNLIYNKEEDRKKEHFFTFEVPYNYKKIEKEDFKKLDNFLKTNFTDLDGNFEKDDYESFKHALGYSMTAASDKKLMFFLLGEGNTGKSLIFNEFISKSLNCDQMIDTISSDLICKDMDGSIQSEHEVVERGPRMVFCSEFGKEQKVNATNLKRLTGNDKTSFRPFRSAQRNYYCTTKIWLFSNYMPNMDVDDPALMDRFLAYQTVHDFKNDPNKEANIILKNEILSNPKMIFWFMCKLAHKYIKDGMTIEITPNMEKFKNELIREMDPFMEFFDMYKESHTQEEYSNMNLHERKACLDEGTLLTSNDLYMNYKSFVENRRSKILTKKQFEMKTAVVFTRKIKTDFVHNGVRVKSVFLYTYI